MNVILMAAMMGLMVLVFHGRGHHKARPSSPPPPTADTPHPSAPSTGSDHSCEGACGGDRRQEPEPVPPATTTTLQTP